MDKLNIAFLSQHLCSRSNTNFHTFFLQKHLVSPNCLKETLVTTLIKTLLEIPKYKLVQIIKKTYYYT